MFKKNRRLDLTPEERKIEKENKITKAALASFKEKGIEETSIRDIMSRTDLGLGTFYLYFRDKKDLEEKIVLDTMVELVYNVESKCKEKDLKKRLISFFDYIIDHLINNPFELKLISSNLNWALYAKVENDNRFKEAETTLHFILNKYSNLFPAIVSYEERLFIMSLAIKIVLSTCESALMDDSVLGINDMKPVLFKIVNRLFR
ncbi:MAG: TetR/AcrR family transcriptional regulator [Peptoniphilus sp.]|uniref:TetR/AcrR family transcriptional regulator n=1 Tax=Peptoniphilus sp. TaxID=1971214 RepID=UPI0025CD0EAC|nr:TetR/AcrR family transcriptional regulator [Peptoniphilus sp.]MCI5643704.1 TetR/AcrR family transcriptional regulator [Peptoniphilus sp.]MDD7351877.1 TetR/AcrR family transcriptional regulator [Peptoniphilaceae bacterium]